MKDNLRPSNSYNPFNSHPVTTTNIKANLSSLHHRISRAHLSYGTARVAALPPSPSGTCGTRPARRWEESG